MEHSATDIILEFYSSSLAELQFMDLGGYIGAALSLPGRRF